MFHQMMSCHHLLQEREENNILYHGHVDLVLLDSLCPQNCIIQTERTFSTLKLTMMEIFNILVDSVAPD